MFEYFISLLSSDAFLAKLLKDIGLSDAATGLLSSVISFAFLFKLLSIPLAGKLKSVKKPVIILDTLSQLLFAGLYAIPFIPLSTGGKAAAVTVLLIAAYLTLYLNFPIAYKWGNSFVSPEKRGDFSAVKEMISLAAGIVFTLLAGAVTDSFENRGDLHGSFVFLGTAMTVISIFNLGSFAAIKDTALSESSAEMNLREIFTATLGNRNCRNAVILTSVSEFSRYITIGFMGTYKTADLGFSVGQIQLINTAANVGRFIISKPFGCYSDSHSYSDGYFLGNILTLLSFITGMFTTAKTRLLIIPFTMLYQMSFAGTNQNNFNMMYSFSDSSYILPAMAVNDSIRGISGFAGSLIGGKILSSVQKGNRTGGTAGQQLLCGISAVFTAVSLIFNKIVVSKQREEKK